MRGSRRLPTVAPHPSEDGGLRVYIDVPGLNQAASLERLWPSRAGRCEGPPNSYVCMPFGLPGMAMVFQRCTRDALAAREARHQATLVEMEVHPRESPEPPGPLEAQG